MGESAVLLGQLLGASLASGLNLYITIAILGIASRLGWFAGLPPGLQGLENGLLIGSALVLFLIEFVVDKVRHLDSLWDTIHTFIRPSAAALIALGAFAALPLETRAAAAVLAGTVALAAHGAKAGLRLALHASAGTSTVMAVSLAEDAAAVVLAVGAFRYPSTAPAPAGGSLALVALAGPRLWRAATLGIRALVARVNGFFKAACWHDLDELPADLRALVGEAPLGAAPPRAGRAAARGLADVGAYRSGWLVITPDGPAFLYRTLFRARRMNLPPASQTRCRRGLWADAIEVRSEAGPYTLFLLKDGPPATVAASHLETVSA